MRLDMEYEIIIQSSSLDIFLLFNILLSSYRLHCVRMLELDLLDI